MGVTWLAPLFAAAQTLPSDLPTFAQLEAQGATVGEVRISAQDVFDTTDPKEDRLLFRWANTLHISTRPSVIRRALLFKPGDKLSVHLLEETERLLRSNRYLYDVQIRPVAVHDGMVDIEVMTRDTWSLDPGFSAGRSGGANTGGFRLKEYNLLGTGVGLSLGHSKDVDRSSNEFQVGMDRAFGTWTSLAYSHASNSDGQRDAVSVVRPFYALDARWAAGATASKDERIDAIYNAGNVVSQYRHRQQQAEVFGGVSDGLVDGWVQRYSAGLRLQDDRYDIVPTLAAPERLPADQRLVYPFVRYELLEDRYERQQNRNLIGRPEFFAVGFATQWQLGWAPTAFGSSRNAWVYSGSVSRGFEPGPQQTLIASARIAGQYSGGLVRHQRLGAQLQYYLPQSPGWLFFASAAADSVTRPNPDELLQLGGDNGLRGYPLRYQSGTRRALLSIEQRAYSDWYVWQLFRVGGAAFFDVGRAWGGDNTNLAHPDWLSNAGIGLRIVSARAAFSNVLHVDVALPLNTTPDIKRVQFLVRSRASF